MRSYIYVILYALLTFTFISCSSTSSLHDDEQLYTGMKRIDFRVQHSDSHTIDTQAEIEASLACKPNGAFFGSSYYRMPFPYRLWIWNAFSAKESGMSKWIAKTFGTPPVLVSDVNPAMRANIAETVLDNNGYFRGRVDYKLMPGKTKPTGADSVPRARTAKIAYTVDMGPQFVIDTVIYKGFTDNELKLISDEQPHIKSGEPFSISKLDAERNRIYDSFKNHGYYFFQKSYLTYMADTVSVPQRVQLQLCKIDSIPAEAQRQWHISKTIIQVRRHVYEQPADTFGGRRFAVVFGGERPPIRPYVLMQDVLLRPGSMFSQRSLTESLSRLTAKGIFSSADISMTPVADSLHMTINCTLDKPYDLTLQANYVHKTSGRGGPGVGIGLTRRNAFRRGENLSFNLNGSADFSIGRTAGNSTNFDIVADVALEMPRLLVPKFLKLRRRWYNPPTTVTRVSFETINRTGFFRRNIFSAELLYNFQTSHSSRHTLSPLTIDYSYIASMDQAYKDIIATSAYMQVATRDILIPKMRYTYSYESSSSANPMAFSFTVAEAGTVANIMRTIGGSGWNRKDKTMFKTPYSQFLKFEFDWRKSWRTGIASSIVAHTFFGYVHPFGNSSVTPFSERYYMGGANDLRGFATRAVGPGRASYDDKETMYLLSNGNLKALMNIEYRPRIFGSLYGAFFLDAGNVWDANGSGNAGASFSWNNLANDIAVNAGAGIRYDLDFFVLRLDWGFVLHCPYDNGKSGYFNIPSFKDAQCLNFAIGYPF